MSENRLQDLLEKLGPTLDTLAANANWQIKQPAIQARKCDVYKVTGANSAFALKVYKPGVASKKAPKIQYDALGRCNQAAADQPVLRAPRALAFLPDEQAILMEWQSAPTLRATLWQRLVSPRRQRGLITAAGSWLRAFHNLSDISLQPLDAGKLIAKLGSQISGKPATMMALNNDPAFQLAVRIFHKAAATIRPEVPHALLHGDYTPTNLLVDQAGIIGMDMWGARQAPVYEDIARMLAYLGVVSPFALATSPLKPQSNLVRAFAEGYGEDMLDPNQSSFLLILLYQQLRRWLVFADRKANHPYSALARWQLGQNKRLTHQTLTSLKDCWT